MTNQSHLVTESQAGDEANKATVTVGYGSLRCLPKWNSNDRDTEWCKGKPQRREMLFSSTLKVRSEGVTTVTCNNYPSDLHDPQNLCIVFPCRREQNGRNNRM